MLQVALVAEQQTRVVRRQFQFRQLLQNSFSLVKRLAIDNRINNQERVGPSDVVVSVAML